MSAIVRVVKALRVSAAVVEDIAAGLFLIALHSTVASVAGETLAPVLVQVAQKHALGVGVTLSARNLFKDERNQWSTVFNLAVLSLPWSSSHRRPSPRNPWLQTHLYSLVDAS